MHRDWVIYLYYIISQKFLAPPLLRWKMIKTNNDMTMEIQQLLNENKLEDLKRFLDKRQCLNKMNSYLIYLFHIFQSVGILTTTVATGYGDNRFIWLGVGFNFIASLINVFEQTNNTMSKQLLNDIKAIKDGNYLDEGELVPTLSKKTESINK